MGKHVNVNFPEEMLARIDARAKRLGVARTDWIKFHMDKLLDEADWRDAQLIEPEGEHDKIKG